jgi:two-component system, cell cycle sensor histidine kinase and response regulator CckA
MVGNTIAILLVEDNPGDARLIREMLAEAWGGAFALVHVERLDEAVAEIGRACPDVLLVDLNLPDSAGLDTFRRVQQAAPGLPLIVLTGVDDTVLAAAAVRAGAQDYLVKSYLSAHWLQRALAYALERHRAGRALRASEERYRLLFNSQTDVVMVHELADDASGRGRYLEVNDAACALLGRSRAEILRLSPSELFGADLEPILPWLAAELRERGSASFQLTLPRQGRRVPVEVRAHRFELEGRTAVLSIGRDVSERRRAEEHLQERDALLQSILDNVQDAYFRAGADGRFIMVSPSAVRLYGYDSVDEMVGLPALTLYAEAADRESLLQELRASGRVHDRVGRGVKKDGGTFWASINAQFWRDGQGRVGGTEGFVRDVTDRQQAAEALRTSAAELRCSHAVLRGVLDGTDSPIFALDSECRYTAFNEAHAAAMQRLYGATIELGHSLHEYQTVEEDRELSRANLERTLRGERVHAPAASSTDGARRLFDVAHEPIRDGAGVVVGAAVFAWEVTELRSAEEQLRQAQKLEAVGRLAGGLAHDFNNLMTVALMNCHFLDREAGMTPSGAELVGEIRRAAHRASDLARQLLAFSRRQVLQPQVLDLGVVLDGMDKMLRRLIGEDVELITVSGQGLWPVLADPGQIEQVIMNLAVNARDAMPRGGRLTLETANVELGEEHARQIGTAPGQHVMLAIADSGCGMDTGTLEHVFEPFFTTKAVGKGTGLGLSTVYGIVTQSGGGVQVESVPDQGTTLRVFLPRSGACREAPRAAPTARPLVATGETILVVEDDELMRRAICRQLTTLGYTLLAAADGEQALALVGAQPARIDVLLSDIVMPNLGGRELAERVAALRPGIKVLFMSGYSGDAIGDYGVLDPSTPLLHKPFAPDALTAMIRQVLGRSGG